MHVSDPFWAYTINFAPFVGRTNLSTFVSHRVRSTLDNDFLDALTPKYNSKATRVFKSSKCSLVVRSVKYVGVSSSVVRETDVCLRYKFLRQNLSTEKINIFGIESYALYSVRE